MSSMLQRAGSTFMPSRSQLALPVSHSSSTTSSSSTSITATAAGDDQAAGGGGVRRRLSLNNLQDSISSSPAATWALHRSKSVSSMGEYAGTSIRKWWDWGWAWVLSRKPTFAQDLEMNDEETYILGSHNKGSWKHVFYKLRSELRKLVGSHNVGSLPQTFRYEYDSSSAYNAGIYKRSTAIPVGGRALS